jgi:Protein of unknown function (DUF3592)
MTMQRVRQNKSGWLGWVTLIAAVLGLFAGLCALFALVVTAAQAWEEHAEAQWPEVTTQVQRCGLELSSRRYQTYWIQCDIHYQLHGQEMATRVHALSANDPSRVIWESSPGGLGRMQEWVDEHPQGTTIKVHYDPSHSQKVLIFENGMPLGGLRTPDNLKLLGFFAASCVVMVTIARMAWRRTSRDLTSPDVYIG